MFTDLKCSPIYLFEYWQEKVVDSNYFIDLVCVIEGITKAMITKLLLNV